MNFVLMLSAPMLFLFFRELITRMISLSDIFSNAKEFWRGLGKKCSKLFAGEGDGRLVASSAPILQKYSLSEFDIKVESDKFLPLYTRLEIDDWV